MNSKDIWPVSLMTAFLVSIVLCLLMPLSMYDSNAFEFPMTAYSEVLFYSGVLTIVVAVVLYSLLMIERYFFSMLLLPSIGLLLGIAVALYAQGNLIGADYGALDGHVIQWDAMCAVAVTNTLIWIACIAVPVSVAILFKRIARKIFGLVVPILLAYVLLLSSMLVVANVPAFNRKKLAEFSLDHFMELSADRNMVVIILDSFDRAIFDKLLNDDPSWSDRFKGFTYYHNAVSAYCYTSLALPHIVTGFSRHADNVSIWQYQRNAYKEAPFLRAAKMSGYSIDAYYDQTVCPSAEELDGFGSLGNSVVRKSEFLSIANVRHYASLFACSAFRYLPHLLKRWMCEHQERFKERFCYNENDMFAENVEAHLSKLLNLGTKVVSLVSGKKVKIYHCSSIHVPTFTLKRAREDLEMVWHFVEQVRTAGVYAKTDFFIMADHGSINRCRPLFMCSNGTDEFIVSEMSFSYRHLFEIFVDSLNERTFRPIEAISSEMVPIIDDPKRARMEPVDEKFFDGIGNEFAGTGLELLATTAEMDVVVSNDSAKMVWNGNSAIIGVPVEKELRNDSLAVTVTFDRSLSEGLSYAVQYSNKDPVEVGGGLISSADSTDVVIKLPDMAKNPDKRFVKLHLHKWEGVQPAPSIIKVKIAPCGEIP